ncbi:MAG TPA: hypothetical protein VKJ47_19160 [Candidatus Binatia bacterium]|nr:hypothetical protein [Candidatus Binatia bacterium]
MVKDHPSGPLHFSLWLFRQLCLGGALGGAIVSGVAAVGGRKDWAVTALALALYALGLAGLTHWALRLASEKKS